MKKRNVLKISDATLNEDKNRKKFDETRFEMKTGGPHRANHCKNWKKNGACDVDGQKLSLANEGLKTISFYQLGFLTLFWLSNTPSVVCFCDPDCTN